MIARYIEYLNLLAPIPDPTPVPEYPIVPEVRENFNRTLREFIELIRQNNAKPLYVMKGGLHEIGQNRLLLPYSQEGCRRARDGRAGDRLERRDQGLQGQQGRAVFAHPRPLVCIGR